LEESKAKEAKNLFLRGEGLFAIKEEKERF
jgi:hypothetical protein